jgi:hypothetical protein
MSKISTNTLLEVSQVIPITQIKPMGFFADVFRFEVRDSTTRNLSYFQREHLTTNKDEAILELKKALDERKLFLVEVAEGIILTGDDPSSLLAEPWYIVYAQKYPIIELFDIPF